MEKEEPYPTRTPYICIVGPTVHDSRWHNIDVSHDRTWLRCVRRITTHISLRICTTVYSNKRFFLSCFDSSACNNDSYVKKLRYVSSSCVQMQFIAAWRGPFLRPWTYYRTDWSGVDQSRSKGVRLCVLLIETREFKGPVRWIARERATLPDLYENTTYSVVVNE